MSSNVISEHVCSSFDELVSLIRSSRDHHKIDVNGRVIDEWHGYERARYYRIVVLISGILGDRRIIFETANANLYNRFFASL